MGYARILVSAELLRQALHLPTDTRICMAAMPREYSSWEQVELTVAHPDLKDVPLREGEFPPIVSPTFQHQQPVVFVEWGQK